MSSPKTTAELRRAFLEFFRERGHEVLPSSSVVPANDPTLLFANAGMVQFKDVFTGREQRPYRRATTSQKCIRISGKHNDLEVVGPSFRHQTFFEMLGNFSFGDYFKEDAITFAWDFLTKVLELPPERLAVTYFRGEDGMPADEEARTIWRKVSGFGDERIIGLGSADNFWSMGDTGPCGPCSEIYYYIGPEVRLETFGQEQTADGEGWVEFWNLVFMQFERSRSAEGALSLAPLPAPSIDTGMGLERLACILQEKRSNYETDVLRDLVDAAARISGKQYGGTLEPDDVSMRVIADHARTTAFMIADGVTPDRTGREYVLRRVMRRAIRHGHRLGIREPFLHEVTMRVVDSMGEQYPELRERRELIRSLAEGEEVRFRRTLARGLVLLEELFEELARTGGTVLPGHEAFKLYGTYGFPLDLTEVLCTERGYTVDREGYDKALEAEQDGPDFESSSEAIEVVYREALKLVPGGAVRFSGYEKNQDSGTIVALVVEGALRDRAEAGQTVEIVTDVTPFYGEAGGQAADLGQITGASGAVAIEDAQKPLSGLVVHRGRVSQGRIAVGERVELAIDVPRRERTRRNHSATHLLHWALRTVVGQHAQQKGSVVGPERLRFDFASGRALTPEELARIEELVNERTLGNHAIRTEVLTMDEARRRGATMIFEEKYGDVVRMLSMAESTELCGGTHARATGDIGLFKIVSEQGIAAGVRRIVAVTGEGALAYVREVEGSLGKAAQLVKATPATLHERLGKLLTREKQLEKQIEELTRKLMLGGGGGIDTALEGARDVSGVKVLGLRTDVTDRSALRELAEKLRDRLGESIVLVGSEHEGKAQLVLTVSKALTDRFKAGDLIGSIAGIVGGSGGGRPDMAQAGGTNPSRLDEAIQAVYAKIAS